MSQSKSLVIGLFGFGVVGEGIYKVLEKTPGLDASIKKICIKQAHKKRQVDPALLTTNYNDLLQDDEINLVVELIDDDKEAFKIVSAALKNGKAVVSANKKMIAEHLPDLIKLQQIYNTPFLYEAAVCGSIPIIRNLEEYYDNDLLQGICGIVNGSTNYILTSMLDEKIDYKKALSQAQMLGFAESNPVLDVEGIDAVNKLCILLLHAYGMVAHPGQIISIGINRLHDFDGKLAAEKGWQIKLIAQARKLTNGDVAAFVLPQFITEQSQLHNVKYEYNGVVLQSSFADKQFLYGKGAGRYPTSSAVLSDISALRYEYRYEYRKLHNNNDICLTNQFYLRLYISFTNWKDVNQEDFEWIEEFYCRNNRLYLIGIISFQKLSQSQWIHNQGISLIVCPDGIIEDISFNEIRKKSLTLAGCTFTDKTAEVLNNVKTPGFSFLNSYEEE